MSGCSNSPNISPTLGYKTAASIPSSSSTCRRTLGSRPPSRRTPPADTWVCSPSGSPAQLWEDLGQVPCPRAGADEQLACDRGFRVALAGEFCDVALLRRQFCRDSRRLGVDGLPRSAQPPPRPVGEPFGAHLRE